MNSVFWIIFSMLKFQYAMLTSTLVLHSPYYILLTLIGGFLITYLCVQLGRDLEKYLVNKFPNYFRRFSKKTRFLAKLRRKWGIWGIAIITPLIGIPLGVMLALTLTSNKWMIIKPMIISIGTWLLLFTLISYIFF